ncbi:MAG: class I SAM-dependent methyltransferase [Elusimicrobia bacterium]|nr:class I SAM-dependent methyltransferase [Elusimicrobiota bacterium]
MKATPANLKYYWNARAADYPMPFARATLAKTRRIIRTAEALGARFTGRRVLDIGCGTGNYGLPLAARAAKVTGVDGSAAMLKIFRAQAKRRGIKNADCALSKWSALPAARVAGRYDVALASMTMAVITRADILKMEKAGPECCVYIGWAGVRRNALLEKVFTEHGLKYEAPRMAEVVVPLLKSLGRKFRLRYLRDSWTKVMTPAETLREMEINLKVNGVKTRCDWLERTLARATRRGKITQLTRARKAIIVWSNK